MLLRMMAWRFKAGVLLPPWALSPVLGIVDVTDRSRIWCVEEEGISRLLAEASGLM